MSARVIYPTDECVRYVLANLSADDRAEMVAAGFEPLDRLDDFLGALDSDGALGGCIEVDGKPAAIYGVRTAPDGAGVIWMVGTEAVVDSAHGVARITAQVVIEARSRWPVLFNRVWAHHARALRWLEWLGFHLAREPDDEGFIPFYMEGANV